MDKSKKPLRLQRIGGHISEDSHRKLKAKLALEGKTITEWIQELVNKKLSE